MPILNTSGDFNKIVTKSKPRKRREAGNWVSDEARALDISMMKTVSGLKMTGYIPNITRMDEVVDEDGNVVLDENNNPLTEQVLDAEYYVVHNLKNPKDGSYGGAMRCVNNMEYSENGNVLLDGTCPLCEAQAHLEYKLANKRIEEECKRKGLDPKDSDNPAVKAVRRSHLSRTLISMQQEYVLLPFYELVMTLNPETKTMDFEFEKDANGNIVMLNPGQPKPVFHRYFKKLNLKKYREYVEDVHERGEGSLAGFLAAIRVPEFPEGDSQARMRAGQNTRITFKSKPTNPRTRYIYDFLDEDAKKCMRPENVRRYFKPTMIYTKEELEQVVDKLTVSTKMALALMEENEKLDNKGTSISSDLSELGLGSNGASDGLDVTVE